MASHGFGSPLSSINGLSQEAQFSLVAHYDASVGVTINGPQREVGSWNPVDENGNPLPNDLGLLTSQNNLGSPVTEQITQSSAGDIVQFADPETGPSAEGQRLEGVLPQLVNSANYTIFWRGHYNAEHNYQNLGMYAYNLGPNIASHYRGNEGSNSGLGGPGPFGDNISHFDNQDTVWCNIVSGNSLTAYANGINLNVRGPGDRFGSSPQVTLGASGRRGFDFVGEIRDLIIFRSVLSDADRALIRTHLTPPEVVVTNTNDSGSETLRQAVYDSPSNTLITFAPHLSGQTITIHGDELSISKNLTIDASSLPEGITINVSDQKRIFHIQPKNNVSIVGLTFIGGVASGNGFPNDVGGAIYNEHATLSLTACTFSHNSANFGGAIYNDSVNGNASLSLTACSLSHNSADFGGSIFSNGSFGGNAILSLSTCTLSGNSANNNGGGIFNNGENNGSATLSLSACSLSGNSADFDGGGIYSTGEAGSATLNLSDTILAENSAPTGPDLREVGSTTEAVTTANGINLMSSIADSNITGPPTEITLLGINPLLLSPLSHYGGSTMTIPPLPGSPAIDPLGRTTTDPSVNDQRGFPRVINGTLDIGAVEFQGEVGELTLTFNLDPDSDGISNGFEIALGTNPILADAGDPKNLRIASGNQPLLTFGVDDNQQSRIILRLMRSTDLMSFDEVLSNEETKFEFLSDQPINFLDFIPPPGEREKAFYRLEAELRTAP